MPATSPTTTTAASAEAAAEAAPVPGAARAAGVPAVVRAVAVLDLLARARQPVSMARVAAQLDLPKSSVHGLCNTLLSLDYLRRASDGALQIGPAVMALAEAFVASTSVAAEFDRLWAGNPPEETLILSVLNGADVIYVGVRHGARPLGLAFHVGMRLPAHLSATGQALLAHLPPERLARVLPPDPLPRLTAHGPDTAQQLQRELAGVRERGYSVDDEAIREGVVAIAAPIFDATGQAVAAVGVCLNKTVLAAGHMARQQHVVQDAARTLSRRLGARFPEA